MSKLAIKDGTPVKQGTWINWPVVGKKEIKLVTKVLESGNWSYNGPMETEFKQKWADMDEPKEGRWDGENGNYGLVNVEDKPYETFVSSVAKTNANVWKIHRQTENTSVLDEAVNQKSRISKNRVQ